ncbi:hypothetical protein F2Q69_00016431 [Brassica cretica]|uniref:Uncharacterized protein n=1 Tax=Brassica cretica TaxID=69181 RepID=A0A8S9R1F6_BRACR|nr:hypothetical protein F2Q69_00016431 [Brassica cretica]
MALENQSFVISSELMIVLVVAGVDWDFVALVLPSEMMTMLVVAGVDDSARRLGADVVREIVGDDAERRRVFFLLVVLFIEGIRVF